MSGAEILKDVLNPDLTRGISGPFFRVALSGDPKDI